MIAVTWTVDGIAYLIETGDDAQSLLAFCSAIGVQTPPGTAVTVRGIPITAGDRLRAILAGAMPITEAYTPDVFVRQHVGKGTNTHEDTRQMAVRKRRG